MVGGLAVLPGVTASASPASKLPARYKAYAHCPIGNKAVNYCLTASAQVAFTINSTTLDSNGPMTISLGLIEHRNGTFTVVLPTDGSAALSGKPINVPGGLLGIPGASGPLAVTATSELAGLPTFSLDNLEFESGAAFVLPLQVVLSNPLLSNPLGGVCSIGTTADPITLKVTDGTTKPPKPNKPIHGDLKSLKADNNGVLTSVVTLVDNAFAVPGASNCGLDGVLDGAVNSQKGLPSAAGTNAAIFSSTSGLAPASVIRRYLG
jgi:hypothetical protein